MYKIYFPLFDHHESRSNEVRLTHEGLLAHPQVTLVDRPELADYVIFCQNHLVDHCPFHTEFRPIKDRYKERTILLDYGDDPTRVFDAADFRWKLYFKRSCVDRSTGRAMHYGGLRVIPTAYAVVDDMAAPPPGDESRRRLDIACLFDDYVTDADPFKLGRGRLLQFARQLATTHRYAMQIGPVSATGSAGRSAIHPDYKRCLYGSKIVLHANPDWWEGDSRTWEALASGALLFIDGIYAPIAHPLIDGEHLIFYDFTDEGMTTLAEKIGYYLAHDRERNRIARQGRELVLTHHRSLDRVNAIIAELSAAAPPPLLRTTSAPAVDVIVTIAVGYREIDDYRQFISTLRRTGATCPVLIGISDGPEYEPVKRYLLENAVNFFVVPPISPPRRVANGYRFELYRQWLRDLDFRYALILDFRDVFFQRDPFADIDAVMHDCDLYLMSEFQLLTIRNHPNGMNYAWVAEPFGAAAADAIGDEVILNSGAILGRRSAVMTFLDTCAAVSAQQDFAFADQGALNYLAHTGRLDDCGRIKISRAGESLVNNCGFTEIDLLEQHRPITAAEAAQIAFIPRDGRGRLKLYRDHAGWVLDDDGNVSSVVHQYDRFSPEIDPFVARLSSRRYGGRLFVNSGRRRYRGEKFTLSSRDGLKPDAVQRLVAKIKSLPLGRKPLLLLNRNFRRGFVFAYGILNNELLFESPAVRRHFFEESHDSEKCDTFCQKWGYQPHFVDEAEIFKTVADDRDAGGGRRTGDRTAAPAAFIPFSIEVIDGRTMVRWIERDDAPTTMPFFAQMIQERLASGARQRVTGLDALHTVEGPDPVGLVMHLSRSGSTLVMQSLAEAGCIAPISEATPVSRLLVRGDIDERERALLLRGLIRALGSQDGMPIALPSLVKLTSWNVLFLDIIRAAFPHTPWLFLYREPLEVLASHDQLPARWLADEPFLAGLTDAHRLPSLARLARDERCAAMLAAYGRAALAASPAAFNLLNYSQLPAALSTDVPGRFGVATTTEQQRRIADASRIYSKDVSRRRVFDVDRERRCRGVSPESRQTADLRYSRPVHAALEWCRTGDGDAAADSTGSRR